MSQRKLSNHCGIDNADISRMENGEINITLETLQKLAEGLDVHYSEILGGPPPDYR